MRAGAKLRLVETITDVEEFWRWLGERRPVLGVDTETGGLEWWRQPLRMVQFGDGTGAWSVPWERWAGLVHEAARVYDGPTVWHNAKFDLHFLEREGVRFDRTKVHDTKIMAHLIDPSRSTSLKPCLVRYLGNEWGVGQDELKQTMNKAGWNWATIPYDHPSYWAYAAMDAAGTAELAEFFMPKVWSTYRDMYQMELGVSHILMDMESRGIRIDPEYAHQMRTRWVRELDELMIQARERFGVDNPRSNEQVYRALDRDGVQLVQRTKTGKPKMTEDILLLVNHPLARLVLRVRRLEKLTSSYVEKFLDLADSDVLHCDVNQLGARTGRMSVRRPSMQNLPRGPEVRDCFIAREGNTLVLADYDQIELRVMAHYSMDPAMIAAFIAGEDLHRVTAQKVYHRDDISRDDRQLAKNAGFAKIYGAGIPKFSATAGVSEEEGGAFLEAYDREFPNVKAFMQEVIDSVNRRAYQSADGDGWVVTHYGRRQPVHPRKGYKAVNYLIQGTCADILKRKMIELDALGLGDGLVLPVHDELVFDVPESDAEDFAAEVRGAMANLTDFRVPLTVSSDIYPRWGSKYREAA